MTHITKIGNSFYQISVEEKGCATSISKNGTFLTSGRYYPDGYLVLNNCPFEKIRTKLESEIKNHLDLNKVIFPYIECLS